MSRMVLAVLPLLALAACVTTTTTGREVDLKEAAKDNVKLGAHYLRNGNLQTAKDKLERAEKQDPKNPEVYSTMGVLYEELNQPKDAERYYQKALNMAPNTPDFMNAYAVFLCKQGQVDRALPMLEKVIADRLYPQPYVAATNAGVCLRGATRNAEAQRYFERAMELGPTYPEAVIGFADLQIRQGKPAAARTAVERFMSIGIKNPDVLVVGVRATVVLNDCSAAQNLARQLRRDFPDTAQAKSLPQVLSICAVAN